MFFCECFIVPITQGFPLDVVKIVQIFGGVRHKIVKSRGVLFRLHQFLDRFNATFFHLDVLLYLLGGIGIERGVIRFSFEITFRLIGRPTSEEHTSTQLQHLLDWIHDGQECYLPVRRATLRCGANFWLTGRSAVFTWACGIFRRRNMPKRRCSLTPHNIATFIHAVLRTLEKGDMNTNRPRRFCSISKSPEPAWGLGCVCGAQGQKRGGPHNEIRMMENLKLKLSARTTGPREKSPRSQQRQFLVWGNPKHQPFPQKRIMVEFEELDTDNSVKDKNETGLLDSLPVMSKSELQKVALEHGGYATPYLNDTLYLHFKGYRRIENLDEYTGLKSLWLHSNGFTKLENVNKMHELRCLFLQRNCLTKIENLEGLNSLVQLDLSENQISCVEGLSHLPNLTNLCLSNNALNDAASISHLKECKELSAVDLSKNQLAGEDIIDCLAGIARVKSLNLAGNPAVSNVANFRKKVIVACTGLRYLDRPVFDDERIAAEAFSKGGIGAERQMKERLQQMRRNKDRETLVEFRDWQESVRKTQAILPRYEVDGIVWPAALMNTQTSDDDDNDSLDKVDGQFQPDDVDHQATSAIKSQITKKVSFDEDDTHSIDVKTNGENLEHLNEAPNSFDFDQFRSFAEIAFELEPEAEAIDANTAEVEESEIAQITEIETDIIELHSTANLDKNDNVEAVRRVRDSLAIIKCNPGKRQHEIIAMAWTADMDKKLLRYAAEYDNDFDLVSSAMAEEHGSNHVMFDESTCYRRWSLLDLEEGFLFQGDFVLPGTDKRLTYFSNDDGQRKTIEELIRGDEVNPTTAIEAEIPDTDDPSEIMRRSESRTPSMVLRWLPDMDDFSDEDDDDIVHRDEVWQKLEVHG